MPIHDHKYTAHVEFISEKKSNGISRRSSTIFTALVRTFDSIAHVCSNLRFRLPRNYCAFINASSRLPISFTLDLSWSFDLFTSACIVVIPDARVEIER